MGSVDESPRVRVLRRARELSEIQHEWDALAESASSPLTRFEWVYAAAQTFSSSDDLLVVTVWRSDRLVAAAPLVLTTDGAIRRVQGLGHELFEPSGFLFRNPGDVKPIFDAVAGERVPLAIRGVPAAGAETTAFFGQRRFRALRLKPRRASATASISIPGEREAKLVSSGRMSSVRRKWRAAKEIGSVTTDFISPSPSQVSGLLHRLIEVEARSWKGRAGTALRSTPRLVEFYETYGHEAARRGMLRFGFLRIGDACVAARMDIEWAAGRWELKIGYDEQFARVSPGELLLMEALRDAQSRGLTTLHFLGAYEPWQERWGAVRKPVITLREYPIGFSGLAALASDGAAAARRRLSCFRRVHRPSRHIRAASASAALSATALGLAEP